jgi:hypothetical protein
MIKAESKHQEEKQKERNPRLFDEKNSLHPCLEKAKLYKASIDPTETTRPTLNTLRSKESPGKRPPLLRNQSHLKKIKKCKQFRILDTDFTYLWCVLDNPRDAHVFL